MGPIKRIESMLAGKSVDRVGINLWKHFPPYDEKAADLVKKTIQFQERFQWDFVKITYHGLYSIKDWGSEICWPKRDCAWPDTCSGVGSVTRFSIQQEKDWGNLRPLSMNEGSMEYAISSAEEISRRFKGEAPVVATVFNPLTTAIKMSGDKMFEHMRGDSDVFKQGLEVICDTTRELVKNLVKAGVDGIFFASQLGTYDKMTVEEYEKYGKPHDLSILDSVQGKTWFNIMHMHGNEPMFDLFEEYPVEAINWHDRLVSINLREGRKRSSKLIIGGIDEFNVLPKASEIELKEHLVDALDQIGDTKFIFGPGCCIPLNVQEDRFETVKRLLEELS